MKNPTVLVVVVTHNRLELLKRCLAAIQSQCYQNFEILVINNDSTDGTKEYLDHQGVGVKTQANGGAAVGWKAGIVEGLNRNFDLIWLMDDDGFPASDALTLLVSSITPYDACISSVVLDERRRDRLVFPLPILDKNTGNPSLRLGKRKMFTLQELRRGGHQLDYPFIHLFNGALLPTDSARAIGNVDVSYCIYGEELDYLYRLRKIGDIRSILNAKHYHPDVSARPLNSWKLYHYIRNTIIINYRYLDRSFLRSIFTVIVGLFRALSRNGVKQIFSSQLKLSLIAVRDAVHVLNAKN